MNDVELGARRVLDVVRSQHDPSAADAARVRARLKARVLAEPLLIEPTPAPPARPSLLGKLTLAFGGASAGFVAGFYVAQGLAPSAGTPAVVPAAVEAAPLADRGDALAPERAAARAAEVASAARNAATAASSGAPVPSPSSAATPVRHWPIGDDATTPPPRARRAQSVGSTGITPLKAELDGLRRAQELLHQGQPGWALERLKELDRANVSSALLEERMATRAIAECRLGGDAAALTDAFARRYPESAHRDQVRASCERARAPERKLAPAQTETRANSHE